MRQFLWPERWKGARLRMSRVRSGRRAVWSHHALGGGPGVRTARPGRVLGSRRWRSAAGMRVVEATSFAYRARNLCGVNCSRRLVSRLRGTKAESHLRSGSGTCGSDGTSGRSPAASASRTRGARDESTCERTMSPGGVRVGSVAVSGRHPGFIPRARGGSERERLPSRLRCTRDNPAREHRDALGDVASFPKYKPFWSTTQLSLRRFPARSWVVSFPGTKRRDRPQP